MLLSAPCIACRDYWARFERFVKDMTKKFDDVYIVTGPLWMPTADNDGKWTMKFPCIGAYTNADIVSSNMLHCSV